MTTYADLGPPIPEEARDGAPLRIRRIAEMATTTGLGESIYVIDAVSRDVPPQPMTLLLAANPRTGQINRAAVNLRQGGGFVATDLDLLPGNLVDLIRSICLDPREEKPPDG